MFGWRIRSVEATGCVLFRGAMQPRAQNFEHVQQSGVHMEAVEMGEEALWGLRVRHAQWGEAEVMCPRDAQRIPRAIVEHDPNLSSDEREQAAAGQSRVLIHTVGHRDDILRDRKSLLRWLRAFMGDEGVIAIDMVAKRMWSRAALDDELFHDADLDVEGLYALHAVGDDGAERASWLHSHGLAELGLFDFDILNPADELAWGAADAVRAIAFAILEGRVSKSTASFELAVPKGKVRFVDVAEFLRRADAQTRALRCDADDEHNRDRAVLCEPPGRLLGRWLDRIVPSKFLSAGFDEEGMISFSSVASELMEKRARQTYPMLRKLAGELAEFELPVLAKIGYETDDDPDAREYMWFEVKQLMDDQIDGTLVNEPFRVARLNVGDRGTHPVERMNDWTILTPIGNINPRNTRPAREIRARPDEFRALMKEAKASEASE